MLHRSPFRAFVAFVVALALLGLTVPASAQEDDPPAPDPTAEPTPEEPPPTVAPDPTPAVDDPDGDPADDPTDELVDPDGTPEGDPDEEEPPEPRCASGEVDLSPDADEPSCISQGRLQGLLSSFEAAAADEAQALADLTVALEGLDALSEQLEELEQRLGEVQLRLVRAEADARFAAIREQTAQESLTDVEAALVAEEEQLRVQAVEAYIGGDTGLNGPSAILDAGVSYTEREMAREYAGVVIDDQAATIDRVDALREATEALSVVVEAAALSADADAARVAEVEIQARELLEQQRILVEAAETEASAVAERIGEIQERKQAFAAELQISGAGGGAIGETLQRVQAGQEAPTEIFGILAPPVDPTRIGSAFGPRVHPIFGDARLHAGVDISGVSGQNIYSSADGIVVIAEEVSGYGNVVVVDHGDTIATLYAHMTADAVAVGDRVETGDLLGFVGSTGFSTGPHLHFEVRILGQPVDPIPYLDLS